MHSKQKPGLPFNLLNKKPGYKHFWEILGYVPVVLFQFQLQMRDLIMVYFKMQSVNPLCHVLSVQIAQACQTDTMHTGKTRKRESDTGLMSRRWQHIHNVPCCAEGSELDWASQASWANWWHWFHQWCCATDLWCHWGHHMHCLPSHCDSVEGSGTTLPSMSPSPHFRKS